MEKVNIQDVNVNRAKILGASGYIEDDILLLDKLNLKNETDIRTLGNIVPDCWIYVQDVGVKMGRIQIFNNWSPYMVADPQSKVWIGLEYFCNEGDKFWNLSDSDCIKFGVGELIRHSVKAGRGVRNALLKGLVAYFQMHNEQIRKIESLDILATVLH